MISWRSVRNDHLLFSDQVHLLIWYLQHPLDHLQSQIRNTIISLGSHQRLLRMMHPFMNTVDEYHKKCLTNITKNILDLQSNGLEPTTSRLRVGAFTRSAISGVFHYVRLLDTVE